MGRPLKKRRGGKPPKSINIKNADVLRLLQARSAATGLGYTEILKRALETPVAGARSAAEIAASDATMQRIWRDVAKSKADFAKRGEPWPGSDHSYLYDEYGLPK